MKLVTGATGLVGSHLVACLLMQNLPVRAMIHSKGSEDKLIKVLGYYFDDPLQKFKTIECISADLEDIYSLEEALRGIETVYHCAGMVSFNDSDHTLLDKINSAGTANLIEACKTFPGIRLVHLSSIATVGEPLTGNISDETAFLNPRGKYSGYAISKFNAEREVWRGMEEGLTALIVNPSTIIGPGHWGSSSTSLFTTVNRTSLFYTEGSTGYVDVRDVCRFILALEKENAWGERYILNGENLSFRDIIGCIARSLNKKEPSVKAGPFLLRLASAWYSFTGIFTGRRSPITPAVIRASLSHRVYSNQKAVKRTGLDFIPVKDSVEWTAAFFKKENS